MIVANSQPFSYYSGPTTKHPLIQKYLYWPLGSGSTRKSSDATAASQLKTAYTDTSSESLRGSSKANAADTKQTQNGKQVSFNLSTSAAKSEEQPRALDMSGTTRYEPRHEMHLPTSPKASIYSRMLSTGRGLNLGRYGKASSNEH